MCLSTVEVGLVYFVGKEDKVVLGANIDDLILRLPVKEGTSWITRIDDYECLWLGFALLKSLFEKGPDLAGRRTPLVDLVEVVGNRHPRELGKGCRVEGVLRDGDQDARFSGFGYEHRYEEGYTGRCTPGKKDMVRVCWMSVPSYKWEDA